MARGELERDFARYCEHGDVEALARTFDALAPKLLSLARHVAPDLASAEDLVQTTFLVAIEQRGRFDPERDLANWLGGILTNKARLAHALRSRELDVARLRERERADPTLDVEYAEFVAALETALVQVPPKYRAILRGHLADGKKADQLARELGRESGTVRVQLHRGLSLLRRLLPASFTYGLIVSPAPRGLAAIRKIVMRDAKLARSSAGLAGAVAVLTSKIGLTAGIAAALAVLVAGVAWLARSHANSDEGMHAANATSRASDARDARATDEVLGNSPRTEVATPTDSESHLDCGALELELLWNDGTPAAQVELVLTPRAESMPEHHVVVLRTDSRGRASTRRICAGPVEIDTDRAGVGDSMQVNVAADRLNFERLTLPGGLDVAGHVLDATGSPIAGAEIWLSRAPDMVPARRLARSAGDGSFSVRSLPARSRLFALSASSGSSEAVFVRPEVELRTSGSVAGIAGTIRSSHGQPNPDALVTVQVASGEGARSGRFMPFVAVRTDAGGHYELEGMPCGYALVTIAPNGGPAMKGSVPLEANARATLDFELDDGVTVAGTVFDAAGRPVPGASVSREPVAATLPSDWIRFDKTTSDSAGRFRLEHLPSGRLMLCARAQIDGEQRAVTFELQAPSCGAVEWNPRFDDGLVIAGSVHTLSGVPLANWRVDALAMDFAEIMLRRSASTDAQGSFRIRNLRDTDYTLLLYAPGNDAGIDQRDQVKPGTAPCSFEVDTRSLAPTGVRGRVLDARGLPLEGIEVRLSARRISELMSCTTDARGVFRVSVSRSGDQQMCFAPPGLPEFAIGVVDLRAGEERDLGEVRVPEFGRCEVRLRRSDGAELEDGAVGLLRDGRTTYLRSEGGGLFASTDLYVGRYRMRPIARGTRNTGPGGVEIPEVEIRAGETTRVEIALPPGEQRGFLCRCAKGSPGAGRTHFVIRDSGGEVVFDEIYDFDYLGSDEYCGAIGAGFAPGRYRIDATTADGRTASLEFEAGSGPDPSAALVLDFE